MLRCAIESNENHEARFSVLSVDRHGLARENRTRTVAAPTVSSLSRPVEDCIMWTKPEFTEMRFGFEVTMYIYNR
jgi:pyrroloquinoline quinone biosynthesis protein A